MSRSRGSRLSERRRPEEREAGGAGEPDVPRGRAIAAGIVLGLVGRAIRATFRGLGRGVLGLVRLPVRAARGWRFLRRTQARSRSTADADGVGGRAEARDRTRARTRIRKRARRPRPLFTVLLALLLGTGTFLLVYRALERFEVAPAPQRLQIPVEGVAPEALRRSFDAPRSEGRTHRAIDIPAPRGTAVLAAADGTVLRTSLWGLGGLSLCLRSRTGTLDFVYAHLDELSPAALAGREVRRGEKLGTVGWTGNARVGAPHLHFQILRVEPDSRCGAGEALDPYDLLLGTDPGSPALRFR